MRTLFKLFFLAFFLLFLFPSCKFLRPSLMFKTPKNYTFATFSDTLTTQNYKIVKNDLVRVSLLSNNGFKKVNLTEENSGQNEKEFIETLVELDDSIKLPLFGRIKAVGKTTRQLEEEVEKLYNLYYVDPFVTVTVTNRRVMVFHGTAGVGRVIPLTNNNVTVLEAIALSGGITDDGKSYKVKLIRNVKPEPVVYMFDLSTVAGLREGNTVLMANDIIYVEPRIRVARRFANEIAPLLTILSTVLILTSLLKK
ncbi:MAG: polysaccharide biosynthesis/export family protein [Bacteroidia bacterium]|nr:polysaccharide biosynthesis/export family protein [Bacteroidia bacterium]